MPTISTKLHGYEPGFGPGVYVIRANRSRPGIRDRIGSGSRNEGSAAKTVSYGELALYGPARAEGGVLEGTS